MFKKFMFFICSNTVLLKCVCVYETFKDILKLNIKVLKCYIFHVYVIQCILFTNKIHLSGNCRCLLFCIIHSALCFCCGWTINREITISKEVKCPRTILAFTFTDIVRITHNIRCKQVVMVFSKSKPGVSCLYIYELKYQIEIKNYL